MNAFKYMTRVHNFGGGRFWSTENPKQPASNSEVKRWMLNGSVHINGVAVKPNDFIDLDTLQSVVLHPKGKRRTTIL